MAATISIFSLRVGDPRLTPTDYLHRAILLQLPLSRISELVNIKGACIHSALEGWTPLYRALHSGRLDVILYLFERGVAVDSRALELAMSGYLRPALKESVIAQLYQHLTFSQLMEEATREPFEPGVTYEQMVLACWHKLEGGTTNHQDDNQRWSV